MFAVLALAVAAATAASPAPSPSGSPSALKTIATVKATTSFCTSLVTHFNGAALPMIANDASLAHVNLGLESLGDIFRSPDYVQEFARWRVSLQRDVADMTGRLSDEQAQINALRRGESLTKDPAQAQSTHVLAEKMQEAYDHQRQLVIDLQGIVQGAMEYDAIDKPHPLLGETQESLAEPADMKDLKSYLRFDGQRDVIAQSERAAGDIAFDVANEHCS